MLRYEELKKKHMSEILKIYNFYVDTSTATFHSDRLKKKELKQILFYDDILYQTYTIFLDEKIIGYCMLSPFNFREAYKGTVYVGLYLHNDYTQKGYGKEVLEFLEQKALGLPIRSLIALVCDENEGSKKLFTKSGYEQVGYIKKAGVKFNRLLDVIYYQKILRPNFL